MGGESNGWKWWISSIGLPLVVWVGSLVWLLSSFSSYTKQTTRALQGIQTEIRELTKAVNRLEKSDGITTERLKQLGREHEIKWD
jgi:ABC-type multidrug transport system fused ATPase/permease subunit